jgi:hypothetical protein
MTHTLALERVNQSRAVRHAIAQCFGKEELTRGFTQRELAEAFLAPVK